MIHSGHRLHRNRTRPMVDPPAHNRDGGQPPLFPIAVSDGKNIK
jgi:hypothetical protein